MKSDVPVKEGYLLFPPHGILSQLKKWQKKYCQLFGASNQGIERLEIFDSEDQAAKNSTAKIITLEVCIKITQEPQKHQPYVFIIATKTQVYHVAALTMQEMTDWINALQEVAFGKGGGSFEGDCEEENILYYSTEGGVFSVEVVETEASERCGMRGSYTLVLGRNALILRSSSEGESRIVCTWPYQHIRKYGHRGNRFQFEAGRHCQSGEGVFKFSHPKSQEIHHCLGETLRSIERLSNTNSVGMDFPPPSEAISLATNPNPDLPDQSLTASQTLADAPESTPLKPTESCKKKPAKPPRKSILVAKKSLETASLTGSLLDDSTGSKPRPPLPNPRREVGDHMYDEVEMRTEAWRTMGVDEVPHVEKEQVATSLKKSSLSKELRLPLSVSKDLSSNLPPLPDPLVPPHPPTTLGSKFVPLSTSKLHGEEGYDHLQHFGVQTPTSPLSPPPSFAAVNLPSDTASIGTTRGHGHVYRRVNSVPSRRSQEEVHFGGHEYATFQEEGNFSCCRPADDSQTGYATIQKGPQKMGKGVDLTGAVDDPLQHYKCNDSVYAMVNKANGN